MELSNHLSAVQRQAAETVGKTLEGGVYVVTGGTGFVGQRLVEMLVERGADKVISFDIVPKNSRCWEHPKIQYVVGDITNKQQVIDACRGATCVYHIAAAVGPFHPADLYERVNYHGTLNVLEACKVHKVSKLVMSSSPSTRFDGSDVDGLTEDDMPKLPLRNYMQAYAETKAMGEMAVTAACSPSLMTIAVAPHQVYGPRDNLFMPNILEAAGTGVLRIFSSRHTGYGLNRVCFTHVDNYCHGLMCGEKALYPNSPALGKFYIVTDGRTHPFSAGYAHFWSVLDEPIKLVGFQSIWSKFKLPVWLLMPLAHICDLIGWFTGRKLKLNPFNVRVLTMHRWFDISAAEKDLKYQPIISFSDGWRDMGEWFKQNWLPGFQRNRRVAGIAQQSEEKINIQASSR
eukprot:m.160514 g.160514  ORF g.160514 m.160514 type:complete len:401 (+) comp16363_c0_seq1:89-1291(+)